MNRITAIRSETGNTELQKHIVVVVAQEKVPSWVLQYSLRMRDSQQDRVPLEVAVEQ
jgi:hypothetical protein